MDENLQLFTADDIEMYVNEYAIPWGINIAMAILIFIIGRIAVSLLMSMFRRLMAKSKYDEMLINFIESILGAILMLFVIVASLNELGVDTTSLVAIVGAAGLAIGLSLQDSLKNFAAGVMLLVFKPFKAGNFVEAAGVTGVVQKIGIFHTTMTSLDNKEITVPNSKIYDNNITNYSAKDTRRADMVFGIGYDDDLRKAKRILEEMLEADERVLEDPAPAVGVMELGDSSVNFTVRPWVKASDLLKFRWEFTENVKLRFDEEGITIPYPQMDVHFYKEADNVQAKPEQSANAKINSGPAHS